MEDISNCDEKELEGKFYKALQFGLLSEITILLCHCEKLGHSLINTRDPEGHTPMHWAAKSGDIELLTLLQHYGAEMDNESLNESRIRPIHCAATEGKISTIKFLIDNHVDLNSQDSRGCTPVILAAQQNQIACFIYLMKNGADMEMSDINGDTAVHWAAYKGFNELLGVIAFARPQDLTFVDDYGQTALHLASSRGYLECVEYLVTKCRCDPLLKDRNGITALDLSVTKGHRKIEWFIRKSISPTIFHFIFSLGIQRLFSIRTLSSLICGQSDKEIVNWPWRVVFVSNLIASIISAYIMADSNMNNLYILHFANMFFQGLWWFCFLMCLFVSPGVVKDCEAGRTRDKSITYANYLEIVGNSTGSLNEPPFPAVCHSCHVRRPIRAKHCKFQGSCIHKFDHFCPFVGNTVGRDNYKYFVSLLIVHMICGSLFEITCYLYACRVVVTWSFIVFMIYSAMWMMALMGLLNYHLNLIQSSLTTNEHMGIHKYQYFKDSQGLIVNPFDRPSFFANLMDAMFPTQMVYYSREEFIQYERPDLVLNQRYSDKYGQVGQEDSERAILLV